MTSSLSKYREIKSTTISVSRTAVTKFLTTRIATATERELSRMVDMLLEDHLYNTTVYDDDQPGDEILDSPRVEDW